MRTRTLEQVTAAGEARWFAPALDHLRAPAGHVEFLASDEPVMIARAPGRLDVMGGIADYSGSLVLEMPLGCATFAVAQRQPATRLDVLSWRGGEPFHFSLDLAELLTGALRTPAALARWFAERPTDRWAAYVVGTVYRSLTLGGIDAARHGLRLLITSDVPEGKGVSSSAALEVAVMAATATCYDIRLDAGQMATACQWAENHIAGAPCGIMDQMTSALGRRDRLLRLVCQPAIVRGHVDVPAGYRFFGIDSGIRHAVTGADYGTVRTAAFMGYRVIADIAGLRVETDGSRVRVDDDRWGGYLANISPDEYSARFAELVPERMRGAEFLARYGGLTDPVTRVVPDRWYPVRQATSHPIFEHARVSRFGDLLASGLEQSGVAEQMGDLMVQSHESYSACGLGSDGTDSLVDRVMHAGPTAGLFGAKITGGGSGGTVAILGTDAAQSAVHHIAHEYERDTGRTAFVFDASGPGAEEIGVLSTSPRGK